jgi:hypothetical protein
MRCVHPARFLAVMFDASFCITLFVVSHNIAG